MSTSFVYILENIFNNGYSENLLSLITVLSVTCGILVIISKNPVKSVLFLIGLFLTVALYLFGLNMSFIALTYLLVYVGAVSILFLFILMLINVRISELTTDNNNSVPLSIIIIVIFSVAFSSKSLFTTSNKNFNISFAHLSHDTETIDSEGLILNLFFIRETNQKVSLAFSCAWDNILNEMSHITSIGNVLYTSYSLGILMVGLILLLAMIGAISITVVSNNKI